MLFNIDQVTAEYNSKKSPMREIGKVIFSIATLGLGAIYLWSSTKVVKQGEIGLRKDAQGNMVLLPPGRHSCFPWESMSKPKSLANNLIELGPYKIITVESGYAARTLNKGKLEILNEGRHLLNDAGHTFKEFISIKQETKRLHKVQAYTSDNVGITLQADVRYEIHDARLAITKIDDIEESIKQISEMQLSSVIGHHNLQELIPATKGLSTNAKPTTSPSINRNASEEGISEVVHELFNNLKKRFQEIGIHLINIGIQSWSIDDKKLAHELAQGAVIQSQTASKLLTARRDADILQIQADANAKAKTTEAQSYKDAAELLKDHPFASELARFDAQRKIVEAAGSHTNLFYGSTGGPGFFNMPIQTSQHQAAEEDTKYPEEKPRNQI